MFLVIKKKADLEAIVLKLLKEKTEVNIHIEFIRTNAREGIDYTRTLIIRMTVENYYHEI